MKVQSPVTIDHDAGEVLVFGKAKHFAPRQYEMLRALVSAGGKIMTRKQLLDKAFECDSSELKLSERVADQGIFHIRTALGKASKYLVTVNQRGYRWAVK